MHDTALVGGIELGGTKTLLAIGRKDGTILDQVSLPTIAPADLVAQIGAYFAGRGASFGPMSGLGVGAFGPIVIDRNDPDFGCLLETNKPGWSGFDLASALQSACGVAPDIVTDVAAAGIAEARQGALLGTQIGVYLTVGTGIGGAILCGGDALPALLHPEMGHIALTRSADDRAPSTCRFHENCAEGLAAGPAIIQRFGNALSHFDTASPEHRLIADYLGQLCSNLVFTISPQRIVLGGGVGQTPNLLMAVQAAMIRHLAGYAPRSVQAPGFICSPHFGQGAGIIGALLLAGQMPGTVTAMRRRA